ncbi:MAG: hypothetical protein ACJAZK_000252 [Psychroserpens sp.]|jgi:hypothetical protein|uniref:hypothetical protein n=1 Tax=Psychroserpens sp. TaxID=2020870 RepID=UPI0039E2A63A
MEDTLAIREAISAIFFLKSYSVFKTENEFRFGITKDFETQNHTEVLSLYPHIKLPLLKSGIKSKKAYEIINNITGLTLNSSILNNFISNKFYHKSKYNISK